MFHQCKIRNSSVNFNTKKKTHMKFYIKIKTLRIKIQVKVKFSSITGLLVNFFLMFLFLYFQQIVSSFFLSLLLPFSPLCVSCVYICMTLLFCSFLISPQRHVRYCGCSVYSYCFVSLVQENNPFLGKPQEGID